MKTFIEALREQLVKRKKNKGKFGRLIKIIDGPDSKRRTRVLTKLESHARLHLKQEGYAKVAEEEDWTNVGEKDWDAFFASLFEFIKMLLPLILALFGM